MLNLVYGVVILPLLVVITREEIQADVYVGMPEQEAVSYFQDLADPEDIYFYTVSSPNNTVGHVIRENEIGYYIIGINNVRQRWWQPSLGLSYSVVIAISDGRRVSELKIIGTRSGWP